MKKRKSKKKSIMFVQDLGFYTDEVLVLSGVTDKKEVFKYLKKTKVNVKFAKYVLEEFDSWNEKMKLNLGLYCWGEFGKVLVLRGIKDDWDYWQTLMHELHHLVTHVSQIKGFQSEMENQAYLFEYLFKSIRRKLQGVDKLE